MPPFETLGVVRVQGLIDSTTGFQFNPFLPGTGWSVLVNSSIMQQNTGPAITGAWPREEEFECYQISIDGPVGSSVQVLINKQPWNFVLQGWQNYDDPQQTMKLRNGDDIQFAWTFAATNPPYTASGGSNVRPVVTMWLQADRGKRTGQPQ